MTEAVVWKYELFPGRQTLDLPAGAELLTVAAQGNGVFVWVRVHRLNGFGSERRDVVVVATGDSLNDAEGRYIGTAFLGALVFHAFELPSGAQGSEK